MSRLKPALILAPILALAACGSGSEPTADTTPAAPQELRVGGPSASSLTLSWVDASWDETGFRVERAAAEAGPFSTVATVRAGAQGYTDGNLATATRYYYRVRAQNAVGDSAASNVDTGMTLSGPMAVPNAPTQLVAADPTSQSLRLAWTDRSSDETAFRVEMSTSPVSGFAQVGAAGVDAAGFTVSGLAPATTYYFRVRASNDVGDSDPSNTASGTTQALPPQPPAAPAGLAAVNVGSTSLVLTWTDASANESGFEVERSIAANSGFDGLATLPANTTRYQVRGLGPVTTYYFRLRAINAAGASAYAPVVAATTLATPTVPAAPADLAVGGATTSTLTLNWTDRSDNETGFRIERSASAASGFALIGTSAADAQQYVDTTLAPSTAYYYRVNSAGPGGNSAYTAVASGTTLPPAPTVPAAPMALRAQVTANDTIGLSWVDPANNESGFKVWRAMSSGGPYTWIASVGANKTTYANAGLPASITLFYRVSAFNAVGDSPTTEPASASTPAPTAPAAPTALTAALSGTGVALDWADNASNETGFRIERAIGAAPFATLATTHAGTIHYVDPQPGTPGATVSYRVLAVNSNAASAASNVASVRLPSGPAVTLTVTKTGTGSGSVVSIPAGIDCGTACAMQTAAGAEVILTATPSADSVFVGWTLCANTSGTLCTVTPSASKTVFASFRAAQPLSLVASVPVESDSGAYTLTWTYSGPGTPSAWTVEEDKDLDFAAPAVEQVTDAAEPFQRVYSGKAPGRYCYRVRTSTMDAATYGTPACVNVVAPQAAYLQLNNRTQIRLVSLLLNGQAVLSAPGIAPQASKLWQSDQNTTASIQAWLGTYGSSLEPQPLLPKFVGNFSLTTGTTTQADVAITLGKFLNNTGRLEWRDQVLWKESTYLGTPVRIVLLNDDSWRRFDANGLVTESGRIVVRNWPADSVAIKFALCKPLNLGCYEASTSYPWGMFMLRDGPTTRAIYTE